MTRTKTDGWDARALRRSPENRLRFQTTHLRTHQWGNVRATPAYAALDVIITDIVHAVVHPPAGNNATQARQRPVQIELN
jgi:hypothetical protein